MIKNILIIIFSLQLPFISGCTTFPIFQSRTSVADHIADRSGLSKEYIKANDFTLLTYQRFNKLSDKISIYIEGDGRAWDSKFKISEDPTPLNPIALKLAMLDQADNLAYIARPGQYSLSGIPDCDSKYWSSARFSLEVIESINHVIDVLKEKSGVKYVELMGYSGGGAIAVLVAARREDVIALRTIAGNLDTDQFCKYHHVSPMNESMNPLDVAKKVAHIPQRHFAGTSDKIIPLEISQTFVKKSGDKNEEHIVVINGVSHHDGWAKHWKELLRMELL